MQIEDKTDYVVGTCVLLLSHRASIAYYAEFADGDTVKLRRGPHLMPCARVKEPAPALVTRVGALEMTN